MKMLMIIVMNLNTLFITEAPLNLNLPKMDISSPGDFMLFFEEYNDVSNPYVKEFVFNIEEYQRVFPDKTPIKIQMIIDYNLMAKENYLSVFPPPK